ncbi:MAG: hypothetical protein J7604_17925 [Sporocytophaga sp.]|uniref:hypothetical protein n=1 Tax=Sporocytophaga sp. TaxID=2231183 RepID=UPI001B2836F9|nr:hypothetical protein [Sporocytophaga sp.]MBO9702092.1 hypothetical protein [Sporocytophaga sp.]
MQVIRRIRIVAKIISIGLLFYLLGATFLEVDFAEIKNNHLISFQKAEIDAMQNIDTAKKRAKEHLDAIHTIHKNSSVKSSNNLRVLFVLLIIQTFLLLTRNNPDR